MGDFSAVEHGTRAGGGRACFELTLSGAVMELTLAAAEEAELPSAAEILAALNDGPVDTIVSAAVFTAVRESATTPVPVGAVHVGDGEDWAVKISPSRMAAYAVAATRADGDESPVVSEVEVRQALATAGVTHGVLQEAVAAFGGGRPIAAPVLLARGDVAVNCRQAEVEFLFETNPSIVPAEHEDGSVDYRSLVVQRWVEAGTPVARRSPPVEGKNGRDVTGREIVVARLRDHPLSKHQGKGTTVEGETLVATQAGRPVLAGERVEVLPFYDVKRDLDFSVGNIDFTGDVTIHGDVHPGFRVRATGTVTVQGIVDRATIIAGGDVLARAITGDEHSSIEAGHDVVAQYLHNVRLSAKGSVEVQREILHSQVEAGRIEVPSGGRIVGGHLSATTEITTGVIGSVQAIPTYVEVGTGAGGKRPVVRAAKRVYFGSVITVAHGPFAIDEDLGGSSFWAHEGEVVRLDPASTGPNADLGAPRSR
ncbi:MAG: DUF342 domain-containing protein [Chloroflexi bacterium]|nr:DUF342 domain-containing protein [Chloroflexota bacterium]